MNNLGTGAEFETAFVVLEISHREFGACPRIIAVGSERSGEECGDRPRILCGIFPIRQLRFRIRFQSPHSSPLLSQNSFHGRVSRQLWRTTSGRFMPCGTHPTNASRAKISSVPIPTKTRQCRWTILSGLSCPETVPSL